LAMSNNLVAMNFPEMKRRWDITIFRNEVVEGGVRNVIVEQFRNVRSRWISGEVLSPEGLLQFVDESGKEVVVSSVPFIAREVASAS